jgi:hypothetical protein
VVGVSEAGAFDGRVRVLGWVEVGDGLAGWRLGVAEPVVAGPGFAAVGVQVDAPQPVGLEVVMGPAQAVQVPAVGAAGLVVVDAVVEVAADRSPGAAGERQVRSRAVMNRRSPALGR